ncbi:uncharacterized protein LOC108906906 [Anoplophora glabripennis]|uniref:uncharacterized protein LOC108906906 n=1 Tax=Anoplophora glabripennis TaxID=217634 RepID=UPI000874277E|nr:uncharacterized protein LOC108906906 [Anoplophora glabripennis]
MKNSVFVFLFVFAVISHRAICGPKCKKCDGGQQSACFNDDKSIEREECNGEESFCYVLIYKLEDQGEKMVRKGCCNDGKLSCSDAILRCGRLENCIDVSSYVDYTN